MFDRVPITPVLAFALAAFVAASPVHAQQSGDGQATVTVVSPVSVVKLRDLDFGTVFVDPVGGGGSVIIDPNQPEGSELSVTGGLLSGNDAQAAKFAGSAGRAKKIKIRIPKGDVTLTRIGGTETLVARNFTLEGNDQRTVGASEYFDFRVGATLNVPATAADGVYEGTFQVTVQYP